MDRETERALIRRVHALLDADTTDMVERESSAPVAGYLDPDQLRREEKSLFQGRPRILAHRSELPGLGDFRTLEDLDGGLLLVRDDPGPRAFVNVCRHRGTRLVEEARGTCRSRFVCPYHAWSYRRDGRLERIPDPEGFPSLAADPPGLVEKNLVERHGFLWLLPEAGADLPGYLDALDADLAGYGIEDHALYKSVDFAFEVNWKLAIDVFLEGYHLRSTHARTIYPMFFDNLGVYERYGPHLRNLFPKRSIEDLRGSDPASWRLRDHANVLYVLFPNTLMLAQPDHLSTFQVLPRGVDRCALRASILIPEPASSDRARDYWDRNVAILFSAIQEDFAMATSIQRGLKSGANERLRFGRYEQSLGWFHGAVAAATGALLEV